MRIFGLVMLVFLCNDVVAQTCTTLGQTPSTAFPVCGESTFSQTVVPECSMHSLYVPGCTGNGPTYADLNPFWYKFTCYQTGTLGFLITPSNLGDDYDWMLYDITGHNPNDIYTDKSLIVTGNWAGTSGLTGASASGVSYIQCASDPADRKNTFSTMPTILQGHQYLLLISHFDGDSQSGYKLSFGGGTGVITDPKQPAIANGWPGCGGVTATIVFNKKLKCNSLATNGSDFSLSPANATIVSAKGLNCSNSFDMDTVVLTMSNALVPGNYTISIQNGQDGNTLLDNCNNAIPVGNNFTFTVTPVQPTPMDSIAPVGCAPNVLHLVFKKPMNCNSIAANGSDFVITGSTPVTITGASGNCVSGVTTTINVQLSAPIQTAGHYQIKLVQGNDGNTVIDECGQHTLPGATLDFTTSDTVNAGFSSQIRWGCKFDTVNFAHPGGNSINQWNWNFDNVGSSNQQNPTFIFPTFGPKDVQLIVSNGVCQDTAHTTVLLDNELKAAFGYPDVLCPLDKAIFTDSSIGKVISWKWDFANGSASTSQNPPPQTYPMLPATNRLKMIPIQLIVENNLHCFDTVVNLMKMVYSCYITIPNGFTPNGDGINDYLYPLNAYKAINLEFNVYNRYGQLVFHTTDWTRKWDGNLNGLQQPTGTYVWFLRYTDRVTGEKYFQRGTTVLIR